MNILKMSFGEVIKQMEELDSGFVSLTIRDKNNKVLYAFIVLIGDGTDEILDSVNEIYDRQDREAYKKLEN